MDALIHLVYASTAVQRFDSPALLALLAHARKANAAQGVTGLLLHEGGHFFQVLEGREGTVLPLFDTIRLDCRHDKVVKIVHEPIPRRSFGDWTMAFAELTPRDLGDVEGLGDFFTHGASFARLGGGRAKKLLGAFKSGRWRARLGDPALMGTSVAAAPRGA